MSKLMNSLRDSITAEKKSLAEKPADDLNEQTEVITAFEPATPTNLVDVLREKLSSKNLPASFYQEILLALLRANLINKHSEDISKFSTQVTELAKEYLELPIDGVQSISRLNLDIIRKNFVETLQSFEDLTAMKKPIGLMACFSQMLMNSTENNKNYFRGLTQVLSHSQQELRKIMQTQQTYTMENFGNIMSGYALLSTFKDSMSLKKIKS